MPPMTYTPHQNATEIISHPLRLKQIDEYNYTHEGLHNIEYTLSVDGWHSPALVTWTRYVYSPVGMYPQHISWPQRAGWWRGPTPGAVCDEQLFEGLWTHLTCLWLWAALVSRVGEALRARGFVVITVLGDERSLDNSVNMFIRRILM